MMTHAFDRSPVTTGASPVASDAFTGLDAAVFVRAAALFFALGDPARLRVLALLQPGELCVSALADALGEEMSTVSQRLRLLRFHGLVARRKQGKNAFYRLADAHVAEVVAGGLEHAAEVAIS